MVEGVLLEWELIGSNLIGGEQGARRMEIEERKERKRREEREEKKVSCFMGFRNPNLYTFQFFRTKSRFCVFKLCF